MSVKPDNNVTEHAVKGIDLDEWGSAEVLVIDDIHIDPDYQRDLRHDLINRISQAYDMVKAGPILVSEREDGSLWCVDGQHRMLGAKQSGESEVFANVIHGLTQEREAELRLARNDRKSDTIYEKFRTRLVMGDKKAQAIQEVVVQNGARVNLMPSGTSGINAIATLETIYDIDGRGAWLGRTLRTIREAFGEENMNPDHCGTSMMKAVCWFLAQHVDANEVGYSDFVQRVATHDAHDIRRKAVSHKAANGGAMWINYYRALVELWNFRRQEKRMIRWKTVGSLAQLGDERGARKTSWDHMRVSG